MRSLARHACTLAALALLGPTLVVPIRSWHHHQATDQAVDVRPEGAPSDQPGQSRPGSPDDHGVCTLCVTAHVIVFDLPELASLVALQPTFQGVLSLAGFESHVAPRTVLPRGPPAPTPDVR